MKKSYRPFKLSAIAVLLGLSGAVGQVYANDAQFEVKSFQLVGDIVSLAQEEQIVIAEVLENYQGQGLTLNKLREAQTRVEKALSDLNIGPYQVILPEQEIVNGNVYLQLRLKGEGSRITYKGMTDYNEQNIENSLPSLKAGKTYEDGRQWFDKRELNMALENPLKLTKVHYDFSPETQTSAMTVAGFAPYGKTRNYVAVDNYGGKEFDYARLTFGYVNANLTNRDDVLTFTGLTNFKRPEKSHALGLSYSLPFYDKHQSISAFVSYSNLDSETDANGLPEGLDKKIAKGKNVFAGFSWSYYFPEVGLGLKDQLKLNAGYLYRHYSQKFSVDSANSLLSLNDRSRFSIAGGYLGLSGEWQIAEKGTLTADVSQHYYSADFPGASNVEKVSEFEERAKHYQITRYSLGYDQYFAGEWNFNTELQGQYSNKNLAGLERESITGVYSVRGFRYSGASGDKALVWRSQITTPRYTNAQVRLYGFYDWGKTSNTNKVFDGVIVSSAGVGIKAQMDSLSWDIFGVRRLHNHNLDARPNGKVSDRTSVWAKVAYTF